MFFFYTISRGNQSDVVRNINWETSESTPVACEQNFVILATGDDFLSQGAPATSGSWLPQKLITPVIYWKFQVSE